MHKLPNNMTQSTAIMMGRCQRGTRGRRGLKAATLMRLAGTWVRTKSLSLNVYAGTLFGV